MRRWAAKAILALAILCFAADTVLAQDIPAATLQEVLGLNDRAVQAYQEGRDAEAEAHFKRALSILDAGGWGAMPDAAQIQDNLAALYDATGRLAEAEQAYRRVIDILDALFGPDDITLAPRLHALGQILHWQGKNREALPPLLRAKTIRAANIPADHPEIGETAYVLGLVQQALGDAAGAEAEFKQALRIWEGAFGAQSPEIAVLLIDLGHVQMLQARYAAAERTLIRAVETSEATLGHDHAETGRSLNNLAALYQAQARYGEAEPMFERAIAVWEKTLGPDHRLLGNAHNNLAQLYQSTGRYAQAETAFRKALSIFETQFGKDHVLTGVGLGNLGFTLQQQGRLDEATLLMQRSLAILESALGPDHVDITASLTNLALMYRRQGRLTEARPMLERALTLFERHHGPVHLSVATALNNLADLYQAEENFPPAEPLLLRALDIQRNVLGPDHPDTATTLNNLGSLYYKMERMEESEYFARRSLALFEQALGPGHPDLVVPLGNLASFYRKTGQYEPALGLSSRLLSILTARRGSGAGERSERAETEFQVSRSRFRSHLDLLQEAIEAGQIPASRALAEGFGSAQQVISGSVAQAMQRASVRLAATDPALAAVIRRRQDAQDAWRRADRVLYEAIGRADADAAESARRRIAELDGEINAAEAALQESFPEYRELVRPDSVPLADIQSLLREDEVLFLYVLNEKKAHLWAVRKASADYRPLPTNAPAVARSVGLIREALEPLSGGRLPPFPARHAYDLFRTVVAPAAELLRPGDTLLIVADGAMAGLPFGLMLTEPPGAGRIGESADLRRAAWLGTRHAIAVLPGVSSLRALRAGRLDPADPQREDIRIPFIGFGDPLLDGKGGGARSAAPTDVFRDGGSRLANTAALRSLTRLPETASELRRVASLLGTGEDALYLGAKATETAVKAAPLNRARVISFATHGVVAGSFEAAGQPGLVLTPPDEPTIENDGLLTAGEVALLRLNADAVILSACNTAAADGTPGAEGLSGLAKAFLYAGARSMLVSHWPVDSDATVALMTGFFEARGAEPGIGRAEALRRARRAMIEQTDNPKRAHPFYWAPFVVVGEGGADSAR